MNNFDIVLMDIDNTLLDFDKAEKASFSDFIRKVNIPYSDEMYEIYKTNNELLWKKLEKNQITLDKLLTERFKVFIDLSPYSLPKEVSYEECNEIYLNALSEQAFKMDYAEELCSELYGKCKLYIISNGLKRVQYKRIEKSGLGKFFDYIFISEEIGYKKPQKEFFDFVFEKIGLKDKSRAIVLGDSLTADMQGGKNSGLTTCWISSKDDEPENKALYDYKIKNLREFKNIVIG